MSILHEGMLFGTSYLEWLKGLGIGIGTIAALWALRELLVRKLGGAAKTETWVDDLFLLLARRRTSRIYMLAMGVAAAALYETSERDLPTWLRLFTVGRLLPAAAPVGECDGGLLDQPDASHRRRPAEQPRLAGSGRGPDPGGGVRDRDGAGARQLRRQRDARWSRASASPVSRWRWRCRTSSATCWPHSPSRSTSRSSVGDEITVADVTGRVEKVGLKTTRLRLGTG